MKVYPVTYIFKNKRDYDSYMSNMDNHPVFKYLSKGPVKALDAEDCTLDDGRDAVELTFQTKKDAETFAHHFGIDDKIKGYEFEQFNPWLPDGCADYDEAMNIYGEMPGDR